MNAPLTSDIVSQEDYESLAAFRYELRHFLQFSEKAAKSLGLTPQQHQALLAIRAAPSETMGVGDLGEQLFIQPHSASELVDRLISLGLLKKQKSQQDRRRMVVVLTPAATGLLGQMSAVHRAEVVRIRETLTAILTRL